MLRQRSPRQKNDAHLDFIRSLPCACCWNDIETEAAHLRTGNLDYGKRNTGGAEKPSDKWVLPLCNKCHSKQHGMAEVDFWGKLRINPFVLAMTLYANTGDYHMACMAIERQRGMDD